MTITCRMISECVSEAYGIPLILMYSRQNTRQLVTARRMGWRLARDLTGKSYPEIGRYMGGRDHTSVIAGVRSIDELVARDPATAADYEAMRNAVLILGQSADKTSRLEKLFLDHDAVAAADRYLNAQREALPSAEEVRALAMGVVHYAAELKAAQNTIEALTAELAAIAPKSLQEQRLTAAASCARAYQHLQIRKATPAEQDARNALEATVNNLSTLFQKDMQA